ncbi:MAG: ThuA domain-containing protein [Acidimicrobiales bacterium]|nr:ThuA domain-containing protein [Hyphomonadaceae bacterium]RZV40633.1 MAG: ThuA domain-containing protein [Acidimicrobiales bacterium]
MKRIILFLSFLLIACSGEQTSSESGTTASPQTTSVLTTRYFQYLSEPSILIFSATQDWRHEEGIAGANLTIMKLANEMGYSYFTSEDPSVFNDTDLARFKIIVFNNMTGDTLNKVQEAAFEKWQSAGNGTVLIHGAGDSSHMDWDHYHNGLIGATFVSHPMAPQFQEARLEVLAPSHPVMKNVPPSFFVTDEWYTFDAPPTGNAVVLAGLDESTYSPVNTVYGDRSDLRMGPKPADHPIIWARCMGPEKARTVFTAIGHRYQVYDSPDVAQVLNNTLYWVAKETDPQSGECNP